MCFGLSLMGKSFRKLIEISGWSIRFNIVGGVTLNVWLMIFLDNFCGSSLSLSLSLSLSNHL